MNKYLEKLKDWSPKKQKIFLIIAGVLFGLIVWFTMILGGQTKDGLLMMLFVVVFVIAMIFRNKVRDVTGWNMNPFSLAMGAGVAAGIISYVIYGLATGLI